MVAVEEDGAGGRVAAHGVQSVEVLVEHQQVHHVLRGGPGHAVREVHDAVPVSEVREREREEGVGLVCFIVSGSECGQVGEG